MFPYRVKYTESESHIKNTNLLYKVDQKWQHTFEMLEHFENSKKLKLLKKNILYKFHKSYVVMFVIFVIWGILYFYIDIYYTCRSLTRDHRERTQGHEMVGQDA